MEPLVPDDAHVLFKARLDMVSVYPTFHGDKGGVAVFVDRKEALQTAWNVLRIRKVIARPAGSRGKRYTCFADPAWVSAGWIEQQFGWVVSPTAVEIRKGPRR